MANITDFPARGRIIEANGDAITFQPTGTNYQLHLRLAPGQPAPQAGGRSVEAMISVRARKIWTVRSGGNFVAPIFGPPKTIQGRVKWLDERTLVVHAGMPFVVEMPASDDAIDLANGAIAVSSMVNLTALPGAVIELGVPTVAG